jgi:hypothetical protein
MDSDITELKIAVAVMAGRIDELTKTVDRQGKYIEELLVLSNKGKGAAWILIGMGGIVGALLSKLLPLSPFIAK